MFFDINDIYIGKIYDIFGLETNGAISDSYSAFIRTYDENKSEYNYALINRGEFNKKTLRFKHNTIFKKLEDIDININYNDDIPSYYVDDLKPITKFISKDNIRNFVTDLNIHMELYKINVEHILKKTKIKK